MTQNGLPKLDLGCGARKVSPEYVGVDLLDAPGVDVVADVHTYLAGLPAESVGEIHCSHFLEHLDNVGEVFRQMERVLVRGGRLRVVVPHFSNAHYYSDPTHRQPFGLYTFGYFGVEVPFKRTVPTYGETSGLRLAKVRLNFKSARCFLVRNAFLRTASLFVNVHRSTQEFYEEMMSRLLPCYEIDATMVKSSH